MPMASWPLAAATLPPVAPQAGARLLPSLAMEYDKKHQIACLLHAVSDTQTTIKNLDTKAQIIAGVAGLVLTKADVLFAYASSRQLFVVLAGATFLAALLVIKPRIRPSRTSPQPLGPGGYYYVQPGIDPAQAARDSLALDWGEEIYRVLNSLAAIRERKTRALRLTTVLFVLAMLVLVADKLGTALPV